MSPVFFNGEWQMPLQKFPWMWQPKLTKLSLTFRVDGLLAIVITDRDGVPLVKGCKLFFLIISQSSNFNSWNFIE